MKQSDDFIVLDENDKIVKDKICIIVPKIREWYDIEVLYNNRHYYINIKSSTLKTYDNVGVLLLSCLDYLEKEKFFQIKQNQNNMQNYFLNIINMTKMVMMM